MNRKRAFLLTLLAALPAASSRADYIQKKADKQGHLKQVCANDIDLNCKGLDFGAGLVECLDKNRDVLEDDCKKALNRYELFIRRWNEKHPNG
jgi:hypothetical protein